MYKREWAVTTEKNGPKDTVKEEKEAVSGKQ